MRIKNSELRAHYQEFNRLYFKNRLPKDLDICFSRLSKKDGMAVTLFVGDPPHEVPIAIILAKKHRRNPLITCMSLLHEMAHARTPARTKREKHHGPRWQKEMLRLARIGAFKDWW